MQTVNLSEHQVSLLQADQSQLQSQMVSKVKDIESLEAEISCLTLGTTFLKSDVDRVKQGKFQKTLMGGIRISTFILVFVFGTCSCYFFSR